MDNDDSPVRRDSALDVDSVTKGAEETVNRARDAGTRIVRVAVSDLVELARGALVTVPERPLTVEERTQSLERRIGEIELIAGILLGALVLIWLISRR